MLAVSLSTIRLFLHVLAATVWVGGQLTLAALVPVLRRQGPDAPRLAARRFNLVAWPAYGVLIITGIWNIAAVGPMTPSYRNTLIVSPAVLRDLECATALIPEAAATTSLTIRVFR